MLIDEVDMPKKTLFKSDRFRKNRGGSSRWLELFCDKCSQPFAIYQKDGPGILKRLYLDRISAPSELADGKHKNLECRKCGSLLGVQYIYEKENRPAFRLFAGAVRKQIVKVDRLIGIKL